jgi:NADPH-dependent curcumin reductase CurA
VKKFRVLKSRNTQYPEGKLFLVAAGWRDAVVINRVCDGADINGPLPNVFPAGDNTGDFPASNLLGVIGMPGFVKLLYNY